MGWVSHFALLITFWATLSFELGHPFLVIAGLLTAALTTRMTLRNELPIDGSLLLHARTVISYTPWLLWQIVVANVRVAMIVWNPKLPIDPRMAEVSVSLKTNLCRAIYANSITLTPGTVTIDVEAERFLVHALTAIDDADLHKGTMQSMLKHLEAEG